MLDTLGFPFACWWLPSRIIISRPVSGGETKGVKQRTGLVMHSFNRSAASRHSFDEVKSREEAQHPSMAVNSSAHGCTYGVLRGFTLSCTRGQERERERERGDKL